MTIEFQLQPLDLVAFTEDQRRFMPDSPFHLYYFGMLPAHFVALAVVTESLAVAAVFAVLFLSSSWLVSYWTERCYRCVAFAQDSLSIQTLPRRVTLS